MSDKAECYLTIPANSWNGLWPECEANGVRYVPAGRKIKGYVVVFYYRKPTQRKRNLRRRAGLQPNGEVSNPPPTRKEQMETEQSQSEQPIAKQETGGGLAAPTLLGGWVDSTVKAHPDKPGKQRYEQVPCLVVHRHEVKIRLWNCQHLCWDDEDGDDHFCNADEVTYWMPLPCPPNDQDHRCSPEASATTQGGN